MDTRRLNLLSQKEMAKNQLEVKLILKRAKTNNKIIESRNKAREEMHRKFKERENRLEIARIKSELMRLDKINKIKNRQMSRDVKNIKMKFQQISQNDIINNNNYIFNQNNIEKNELINTNKMSVYSSYRRQNINNIKNRFYEQNDSLKYNRDMNEDLNELDGSFFAKRNSKRYKNNIKYFNYYNDENNIKDNNYLYANNYNNNNSNSHRINTFDNDVI